MPQVNLPAPVGAQDPGLERPERRAGIDPELLGQRRSQPVTGRSAARRLVQCSALDLGIAHKVLLSCLLAYAEHTKDAGMMLTGKVIRFDDVRGYGFIAPDDGGEDVFVHANVLGDDKYMFGPGQRVEFEATDSDRGPKARAVHLLPDRGPALAPAPVARPVIPPDFEVRVAPSAPVAPPIVKLPAPVAPPAITPPAIMPPVIRLTSTTQAAAHAPAAQPASSDSGDEELCDVLTASAFSQEITELLLKSMPSVTAAQILDMRAELINFGRRHGWIEG
jgi:CspA family cold shock protein